jgi:hypothetical protein
MADTTDKPCKGEILDEHISPLQGLYQLAVMNTGRCPMLLNLAPSGLFNQTSAIGNWQMSSSNTNDCKKVAIIDTRLTLWSNLRAPDKDSSVFLDSNNEQDGL